MPDQLRDLKARIRLDTGELAKGGQAAKNFSSQFGGHMTAAGAATNLTTNRVQGLQDRLERLGPVGSRISKRMEEFGLTSTVAAGGLLALAAAGGLAALKLGFDAAHAASDLNEQVSATQAVFGSASAGVIKFGESAAKNIGIAETATLKAATNFGDLFKNVGITQEASVKFSETLVSLAGDLASFKNIDTDVVLEKLRSGLTGEVEPLRELGIFLDDDKVKAKALAMGLADQNGQVTDGAKVLARYNLILEQSSSAQGDYARTASGAANEQRTLGQSTENLKAQIGNGLLPVLRIWLAYANFMVGALGQAATAAAKFADGVQKTQGPVADGVKGIGLIVGWLQQQADKYTQGGIAATNYGQATGKASDIQKTATQTAKDQATALQHLHDVTIAQFNADLGLQQSQLATKDAIQQYGEAAKAAGEAQRGYGASSSQAAAANEELQKSQLAAQQSALQQASAAVEAAKSNAELSGHTFGARDALVAERDALTEVANQLAPGSPLRAQLEAYIATLNNRIPREVFTSIVADVTFVGSSQIGVSARAAGGPVVPGRVYTVGEEGPEMLVMGARGGYVIPHPGASSSRDISVTVNGASMGQLDERRLVSMLRDFEYLYG